MYATIRTGIGTTIPRRASAASVVMSDNRKARRIFLTLLSCAPDFRGEVL